jgi:sugar transferase (PEP-CTERM/EpsH1 system associated)
MLFFSTQLPIPADTGGRIRTLNIIKHLVADHDFTFVCAVDVNIEESALEQMRQICSSFFPVRQTQWDRSSWRYYLKLLANFASPYPFGVAKDYSPALVRRLHQLIAAERFDVLVCDFLQATINLQSIHTLPTVLFQHNVEAEIFRRYLLQQTSWLGRMFWLYQWKKMRRYEGRVAKQLDCCIAVSEADRKTFQRDYGLTNVSTIDTGVDVDYFASYRATQRPCHLVFTGSMDWMPNEDGILWFVHEILPIIRRRLPEVSLSIVGRRPGRKLVQLGQSAAEITVTGRVDDVRPHLAEAAVFVVPLRIGGGTRIKIFEAMASGVPVVSTTVGAEGLRVEDGRNILLADTPQTFAEAVVKLLSNASTAREIATAARNLVTQSNDWKIVARQFAEICLRTVSNRKARANEN